MIRVYLYIIMRKGSYAMISVRRFLSLTCALVCGMRIALVPMAASAEPHAITATGEYTMGEAETLLVARERALEDAKRNAAEQVGVYVTSSSTVRNLMLTQDTVTTMTAAFLRLDGAPSYTTLTHGDTLAITVKATIRAIVDDSDLQRLRHMATEPSRVAAYQQLTSSYQRLQQEAALLQKQLKLAKTPEEKAEITKAIHKNEAAYQSYMMLQQAYAAPPEQRTALLDKAISLYELNVPAYTARAAHRLGTNDLDGCMTDAAAGLKALNENGKDYSPEETHMMQFVLTQMQGSVHFLRGENEQALKAFQQAETNAQKFDIQMVRPNIYGHFLFDYGGIELLQGDYPKAEQHYTQLLTFLAQLPEVTEEHPPVPPAPAPDGKVPAPNGTAPAPGIQPGSQPAAAPAAPPDRRKERLLLTANAHLYRGLSRMQQKNNAGAQEDSAALLSLLPKLSESDRPAVEKMLQALPQPDKLQASPAEATQSQATQKAPATAKPATTAPATTGTTQPAGTAATVPASEPPATPSATAKPSAASAQK